MPHEAAAGGWWRSFVGDRPALTGKLAVTRPDGSPHVTPVWVALDGEGDEVQVLFTTWAESAKGRALRLDPRVSICWDDQRPPFSYVTVFGTAELVDDVAQVRYWAAVIGSRYMGADRAEEFGRRNGVPGELLVRVRINHVVAVTDVAS